MDIEEFIKVEQEVFLGEEPQPQEFPLGFYDQNSGEESEHTGLSIEQVNLNALRSLTKPHTSKASLICRSAIL